MTDDPKIPRSTAADQYAAENGEQSLGEALQQQAEQGQVYAEVPYIVSEEEIEKLAEALALGNAEVGLGEPTREELTALVLWATGGKLAFMLLGEVLEGNLNVYIKNGEPIFGRNTPAEDEGEEDAEQTSP